MDDAAGEVVDVEVEGGVIWTSVEERHVRYGLVVVADDSERSGRIRRKAYGVAVQ